jgi:hypothetical protein
MNINTENKIEAMKQQENPIVLQQEVFVVVANETKIKGYWKNEQGKVYIDNIEVKTFLGIDFCYIQNLKRLLFAQGEEAIFIKDCNNNAIIEDKQGNKTKLVNRISWIETKKPSKELIEVLLKQSFIDGFTVYELEEDVFVIEIYR